MICILFSWCHCHPVTSCFIKIQNGLTFWCRLTQVVLEKRLLNGCNSSGSIFYVDRWIECCMSCSLSVCLSVCLTVYLVTLVSHAKKSWLIQMPFGMWTHVGILAPPGEYNGTIHTHWWCCYHYCSNFLLPPPKKEVMFLLQSVCLFVCLSVCLSVHQITHKLVNGFWRNFLEG